MDVEDSDNEYSDHERELLEKVRKGRKEEKFDSDDEVLGFDDDQQDSMGSDIEDPEDDLDIPNEKAWGSKNKDFYSTDYTDYNYSTLDHKAEERAKEEEEEAQRIQKKLAEQLEESDFGFDLIEPEKDDEEQKKQDFVKTDLTKLSRREKLELFEKENPEFAVLVSDFKARLTEMKDILQPLLKLVEEEKLPKCPATDFVDIKYQLLLNYCVNLSFYLMMKAKRLPVSSHPVLKRLAQFRQLISQMESGQGQMMNEIEKILNAEKSGLLNSAEIKERMVVETEAANEISNEDVASNEVEENEQQLESDKRAITWEMQKNKGLTPHRKKELRNPRVKLRMKYANAKKRRKGAVREVRKEITRYMGEASGIRAGVKKGIKLK